MSERYTKKDAEKAFERLCVMLHKVPATKYPANPGEWMLDYAACYGGYVVEEQVEGSGIRHPLGDTRRTARELWEYVWGVQRALEVLDRDSVEVGK